MSDQETAIHHVSDTALWVAYYRAEESERADALFHDPLAKVLIGDRGKKIAASMELTSKYTRWTLTIRTVLIDRFIEAMIGEGVDTVLNLGAGLDTRPYRMNLPGALRWIEVDHAHLVEYKEKLLADEEPRCRLERVRLDLADREERRAFFADVDRRSKKTLILTEGVLPYLTEIQVAELAADLHDCDSFRLWIAEYFSKEVYRYINTARWKRQLKNAPFVFFPDNWFGFFEQHGWAPRETKYLGEESVRLRREVPAPWWAFIFLLFASKERLRTFHRMTGFVLFQSQKPSIPRKAKIA